MAIFWRIDLFLNAYMYINRHAHTEYLKMVEVNLAYVDYDMFFLYSINTNI